MARTKVGGKTPRPSAASRRGHPKPDVSCAKCGISPGYRDGEIRLVGGRWRLCCRDRDGCRQRWEEKRHGA
jgi:hypothetical protein